MEHTCFVSGFTHWLVYVGFVCVAVDRSFSRRMAHACVNTPPRRHQAVQRSQHQLEWTRVGTRRQQQQRHWGNSAASPSAFKRWCSVTKSLQTSSLQAHGLQHARPPCPSPSPRACSNSCPLSQWCHPPSHPLPSPSPPAFNLSQHQSLFQWVGSLHLVAKGLELQLQHQSFQWIFRTDFL